MLIEDLVSFVVGVSTGVAGALLGLGGGFIFVPYFHLFLGLPMQKAAGSSLAAIVFLTSSAASAYRFQGRIDLKLAAMFLVASAPSAFLGAWLAQQIEAYYLK
ncbi:MAG: sulfite exporter TauE/SafE family protein, partial [Candidatus Hecatellales archaeon]